MHMYSMIIPLKLEMVDASMGCGKSSVQRQIEADKAVEDVETVHELPTQTKHRTQDIHEPVQKIHKS